MKTTNAKKTNVDCIIAAVNNTMKSSAGRIEAIQMADKMFKKNKTITQKRFLGFLQYVIQNLSQKQQ